MDPHVLREYALIADGERAAVLGPRGDVAWLCFPGWSDPAVMAALLGGLGTYVVTPLGRHVWGGRYEPGSLIWRSRWTTETGTIECREALAFPGEPDRAVLLRQVVALDAPAGIEVVCAPAADYGRRRAVDLRHQEDGSWHGRAGEHAFRLDGAAHAAPDADGALRMTLDLEAGERHDLVLTFGRTGEPVDPQTTWRATAAAWELAVPPVAAEVARHDARQARAVLRGLTSAKGGMVAAATMSLPERARAGRSYDYRFAWVRDQAMVGQAAARAGADDLLDGAVGFLRDRLLADGPDLAPAYTVGGGRVPDEQHLGLPGYPGGTDVAGNHVNGQFQLDAFGEALLCLAAADAHDRLDADGWRAIAAAADAIGRRHREPDAGIWELDAQHWTHSRLICAAGLRRVAERPAAGRAAQAWLIRADELVAEASAQALHPNRRWQRTPEDDRVDAALLFAGLRGATAPDDPRALATLEAVEDDLSVDHLAYRFRPDARPLGAAEGAFLLCGFAMALALDACGRHVEAAHWFERNRSASGPPGLLSEEFDVAQHQLRGNLPQAFVHGLLLECACTLRGTEDHDPKEHA